MRRGRAAAIASAASIAVSGLALRIGGSQQPPPPPVPAGTPVVAVNMQICNSAVLDSPYSGSGVTPSSWLTDGTFHAYTSGQYGGLPTFGSAGTNFPNATQAYIIGAGDNGGISFGGGNPNTLYWFAPGAHQGGGGQFGQLQVVQGGVYVGGRQGTTRASWTGQGTNEFGINALDANRTSVTVQYMELTGFRESAINNIALLHTKRADQSWKVQYNYIHDFGYRDGNGNAHGVGFYGGQGTTDHNCFRNIGQTGMNFFGEGDTITFNEFWHMGSLQELSCGCNGGIKGWETTNIVVTNNFIHETESGYGLWLDTSNTGYLIKDNFFAWNLSRAIEIEISQNGLIEGNTLIFNGYGMGGNSSLLQYAIDLNLTGAVNLPGSNYNNSVTIRNNILWDNWMQIGIYEQGNRNCIRTEPPANYCPLNDKAAFSNHSGPGTGGDDGGHLVNACNAGTCTSLVTDYQYAIGDTIGFADNSYPLTVISANPAGGQTSRPATGPPQNQGNWTIGFSGTVSGTHAAGSAVWGAGTCGLYDAANATPTTPTPANTSHGTSTTSYFDGCRWRVKGVSVTGNVIYFRAADIQTTTPPFPTNANHGFVGPIDRNKCPTGASAYLNATAAPPSGNNRWCGFSQMVGGSFGADPYGTRGTDNGNWLLGSIMSAPAFVGQLADLDRTSYGGLGESPSNNVWSGNTYDGQLAFRAYSDSTVGPPYGCPQGGSPGGYTPKCVVSTAEWASLWQQH